MPGVFSRIPDIRKVIALNEGEGDMMQIFGRTLSAIRGFHVGLDEAHEDLCISLLNY
jgi:hypothetical protein